MPVASSPKAAVPTALGGPQTAVPMATVGVDTTHDGKADVFYTGIDRNRDGIPDALQQQVAASARAPGPTETAPATPAYPTPPPAYAMAKPPAYSMSAPQAVESVSPQPVPSRLPVSSEVVGYAETHQVYTRPPTVEKVGYHIEKQQVTEYKTVQVPVTHEVDRIVEDIQVVPAQAVEYVSATPIVKAPQPQLAQAVEYAPAAPPPKATLPARVLKPPPAVEKFEPEPVMVRTAPVLQTAPAPVYARPAVIERPAPREEIPVAVPLSVVHAPQSAPIRQEVVSPPPVMHAPPMAPAPPAPVTINLKPAIPFLAEFVGTFILVFAVGLAAMYGVGMAERGPKGAAAIIPGSSPPVVSMDAAPPVTGGAYCRRCDGSLARAAFLEEPGNQTEAGVSALQVVTMSAKTLKLESTLQKVLTWVASRTCWCTSAYFAPLFGMALLLIIYAVLLFFIRPMSGAHLNPAISLAAFLSGKINLMAMLIYWGAQVLGALLAALLFALIVGFDCLGVEPRDGYGWWQASIVEFIYTALLAFTFLSVHPAHKGNGKENKYNIFLYPFTLMAALGAGIAACAHISGAFLNPASTIAFEILRVLLTSRESPQYWLLYIVMQLLGAVLAAVVFYICRPDERMQQRSATEERFSFFPLSTKLACEFVGTWIFTFTVGCAYWGGLDLEVVAGALCLIAIYTAMCMVSGGHFNPSVTLAVMLSERHILSGAVRDGLWYMLVQLVAASLAAFECAAVHRGRTFEATSLDWSWFVWGLIEALLTCLLVLAFLACTRTRDEVVVTHLRYQIAIALALCFGIAGWVLNYFVLAGSFLNPAIALGLADAAQLLNGGIWYMGLVVAFFDLLGGLAAYGVHSHREKIFATLGFHGMSQKSSHQQFM